MLRARAFVLWDVVVVCMVLIGLGFGLLWCEGVCGCCSTQVIRYKVLGVRFMMSWLGGFNPSAAAAPGVCR